MKVLLAGFEPFGDDSVNSGWEAIQGVPETIEDITVDRVLMPTAQTTSFEPVAARLATGKYDAVIAVGMAKGYAAFAFEQSAINLDNFSIADNAGNQPRMDKIVEDSPYDGLFTTLPISAMRAALIAEGIPATISYSAGTFVCNHLFYHLQYHMKSKGTGIRSGFVHVPALPEMVLDRPNTPSMSKEDITRGLILAIRALKAPEEVADRGQGTIY